MVSDERLLRPEDDRLKMAHMFWVEGRPVYKGDTLYLNKNTIAPGRHFVVASTDGTIACSKDGASAGIGCLTWTDPNTILCEVEGKPVRKMDRLWSHDLGKWISASGFIVFAGLPRLLDEDGDMSRVNSCRWKRMIKKNGWVNIYPTRAGLHLACTSHVHPNEKEANENAGDERIACVRIEWEEEVSE